MDRILYCSYEGAQPYVFLQFGEADRTEAARLVNTLIDQRFRVCYDENGKAMPDAERLAERIQDSELAVFLLSADALKSLAFRSSVNYAISRSKKVFCIYLDDQKPGYGLELQLANIPGAKRSDYPDTGALVEDILLSGSFLQTMRGDDARIPIQTSRKKKAAIAALAAVLALFVIAGAGIAAYRINYQNSMAGQIEKLTEADYLDLSNGDASLIDLLAGKTVKTLIARNMGLQDIDALRTVYCEELDLSNNPQINTLEPLLEIESLKIVRVSQDMYPALIRIGGRHAFQIVITE
ncbi:MAG: TIR domain-containing protein [Clostridiales bacterium]|nr:TIR domain-containing protein [Clostridiales bacterium]